MPLLICLVAGAAQAGDGGYLSQLQGRAERLDLAGTRQWHALLHYEHNWLRPGVSSTVTTPWFFRADNGRYDPAAELRATLAAFMDTGKLQPRDEPAQCVYRARFLFLDRRLQFDPARMPIVDCPRYERWRSGLDPKAVSLVFPAAYLNSPASMFGHTLLRIDSHKRGRGSELLAYAVNFAAKTEEENGLVFAYKGLAGGYPGVYGVFPYYEKVKQYAWIENRDVWDYRLRLSEREIRRLIAHLWEMRGVRFDYYFLNKNCSYQLLSLLQAARPSLHLVERFDWYAIPADTIRALRRVPGLLGPAHFRPSLRSTLEHEAEALPATQRDLARAVAGGRTAPDSTALSRLPARQRARVLEVAHDYLYYRYQTNAVSRAASLPRARRILLARSRIPVAAEFGSPPAPGTPPDRGHRTLRLSAAGVWEAGDFSLGLRVRPAYHDLLDPAGGYIDGAEINFLDLGLRVSPDERKVKLADLTLLDIVSLSPRNDLFKPVSWRVATGLRRRPVDAVFDDAPNDLGYYVEGGPGLAWGAFDSLTGYVFALGSADANSGFDSGYALGAGASLGVLARLRGDWQLRAEFGGLQYAAGDGGRRRWAFVEQQLPLPGPLALRLRAGWEEAAGRDIGRAVLTLHGYF